MLDEVVQLEPYSEPADTDRVEARFLPTDPAIMIPGIRDDGSFYPIEKIDAHVRGIRHLAVSIFIFDGDELLIQQRAIGKYHCGGQWANTCCTHPHWDEAPEQTALRRLNEELGFSLPVEERLIVEYSADVGNGLWEKERVHMFRADVSKDALDIAPNPEEVSQTRWVTASALREDMNASPALYTPWFRIYLNRYPQLSF